MENTQQLLNDWFRSGEVNLVAIDADDTLWHDSKFFRQLDNQLMTVGRNCGKTASCIVGNLKLRLAENPAGEHGYATSIIETASKIGLPEDALSLLRSEIESFLNHPIELLPYSRESLLLMRSLQKILVTKGSKDEQERKIQGSPLDGLFDNVIILDRKDATEWRNAFNSIGALFENAIVIGNSIRHDVIPAVHNGARAVWMNHADNLHGRNGDLPREAYEVASWNPIYLALGERLGNS